MKTLIILTMWAYTITVYAAYLPNVSVELEEPDEIIRHGLSSPFVDGPTFSAQEVTHDNIYPLTLVGNYGISDSLLNQVFVAVQNKQKSNRAIVIDNSEWFPPAQYQIGSMCSYFSLIYYLKSSLWNKQFGRES